MDRINDSFTSCKIYRRFPGKRRSREMMRTKWTILVIVTALVMELLAATAEGATGLSHIGTVPATKIGNNCMTSVDSEVGSTHGSYIGNAKPILSTRQSFGIEHGRFDHEPKYYYYDHGYPYYFYYWPHIRPCRFWPYYHGLHHGYYYYN